LPAQSPLTAAVDATLFKRSGKKVFGTAWHHDGAAKGPKPIGFGNCWVVAGIVVHLPFLSRPVCLPVLARLWRPRHTGKIAHARELAELIAARYPNRTVHPDRIVQVRGGGRRLRGRNASRMRCEQAHNSAGLDDEDRVRSVEPGYVWV